MSLTLSILSLLLLYMWVVVPFVPVEAVKQGLSALTIVAALGLCVWGNRRAGSSCGLDCRKMGPALFRALALTLPAVGVLLAAGWELGTLRPREHMTLRFLALVVWALAQQLILQTVVFREARQRYGPRTALWVAAGLFAFIHLPNPFLVPATFLAGLGWCWLYDRHPSLIPLALSHALASLTALVALGPGITGGMRVGYGYFLANGVWF